MPELQGRFPIRVELQDLTRDDFVRILREPRASLIRQYQALLATEGVTLEFTPEAIDAMADLAYQVNQYDAEHRRAAAAHDPGTGRRGAQLRRLRPPRQARRHRRRRSPAPARSARQGRGPEPVHPLISITRGRLDPTMSDQELSLLNVFEVEHEGAIRHLICFIDPVLAGACGIDGRAVIGEFTPETRGATSTPRPSWPIPSSSPRSSNS